MLIGNRREISDTAEQRALAMKGYIYGKRENGGTSTLYVSPVSFDAINRTMKKQPRKPDMADVQRGMAGTDGMGKAVLSAPVLGIAAGVAGAFLALTQRKHRLERKDDGHGRIELVEHWTFALSGLLLLVTGMFELPIASRDLALCHLHPGSGLVGRFHQIPVHPLRRLGCFHHGFGISSDLSWHARRAGHDPEGR